MDDQLKEIDELFEDADLELIKEVIYFDGWCTYEESGGYLIFKAIDDTLQLAEYGYSVMGDDNRNLFYLQEITEHESKNLISRMKRAIAEGI